MVVSSEVTLPSVPVTNTVRKACDERSGRVLCRRGFESRAVVKKRRDVELRIPLASDASDADKAERKCT